MKKTLPLSFIRWRVYVQFLWTELLNTLCGDCFSELAEMQLVVYDALGDLVDEEDSGELRATLIELAWCDDHTWITRWWFHRLIKQEFNLTDEPLTMPFGFAAYMRHQLQVLAFVQRILAWTGPRRITQSNRMVGYREAILLFTQAQKYDSA